MWSISEHNPEGRAFVAIQIILLVVAFLAVCLRAYSRRLNKATFDGSDYWCLAGFILSIGLVVIQWAGMAVHFTTSSTVDARSQHP